MKKNNGPRVLLLDIETAPILANVWGLFDQTISLNQISQDWHVLSWAAKWLDAPASEVMYMDQRGSRNVENDRRILTAVWKLLDEADVVIGQNSKSFDIKKLNARFVMWGMQPPSSFRQIDTLRLARKHFAFTSNKLEYMTDKLCTKYKKLKHEKFSGFELWKACIAGNQDAWNEMEKYNKYDVLSLEELYHKLIPWDNSINFNVYHSGTGTKCKCGKGDFARNGYFYSNNGKFQRYKCKACGSETRAKQNMLDKDKRASLLPGTTR